MELICQKSDHQSTFLTHPYNQPLVFDDTLSLDKQNQPLYSSSRRKQYIIKKSNKKPVKCSEFIEAVKQIRVFWAVLNELLPDEITNLE
jgi:hypothetical protein